MIDIKDEVQRINRAGGYNGVIFYLDTCENIVEDSIVCEAYKEVIAWRDSWMKSLESSTHKAYDIFINGALDAFKGNLAKFNK